MFTLTFKTVGSAKLQSLVESLGGLADPTVITRAIGEEAKDLTRNHLLSLANARHRPVAAQNFYADAANGITVDSNADSVELHINRAGMAQRYYGGTIKAVNYSHLWIPLEGTEAEGTSAGEFKGLVALINPLTNKGVAIDKQGKALFALVEQITQAPDSSVLPSDAEYIESAESIVGALLERKVNQATTEANTQP